MTQLKRQGASTSAGLVHISFPPVQSAESFLEQLVVHSLELVPAEGSQGMGTVAEKEKKPAVAARQQQTHHKSCWDAVSVRWDA